MRPVTMEDINNMTPEELEELKRQGAQALVVRLLVIFLLKVALQILLRRWMRKLSS